MNNYTEYIANITFRDVFKNIKIRLVQKKENDKYGPILGLSDDIKKTGHIITGEMIDYFKIKELNWVYGTLPHVDLELRDKKGIKSLIEIILKVHFNTNYKLFLNSIEIEKTRGSKQCYKKEDYIKAGYKIKNI